MNTTPSNPLQTQVGGDHYKKLAIQPVEYIHANGLPFIEGCIIKYATRWRDKGGISDLEKIVHFAQLLIGLETKGKAKADGGSVGFDPATLRGLEAIVDRMQAPAFPNFSTVFENQVGPLLKTRVVVTQTEVEQQLGANFANPKMRARVDAEFKRHGWLPAHLLWREARPHQTPQISELDVWVLDADADTEAA